VINATTLGVAVSRRLRSPASWPPPTGQISQLTDVLA